MAVLQGIFIDPPIAVARLGESSIPVDAFTWTQAEDPHLRAETVVAPTWSMRVHPDGNFDVVMPDVIVFRDGAQFRPVAPFFEVWGLFGEPGTAPSTWVPARLTAAVLDRVPASPSDVLITIEAVNAKAARRTSNPALRFGTFPGVELTADTHRPVALNGTSPPGVDSPMVPSDRVIPLGSIQVLRSRPQPAEGPTPWASEVNVEVIRFRFTPPAGRFYGPPNAANPVATRNGPFSGVTPELAFLNPDAGWAGAVDDTGLVEPADTYDVTGVGVRSMGIVDDTSEVRVTVMVPSPPDQPNDFTATATILVAPPDFAPDRRPLLSLADDLNDRDDHPFRSKMMPGSEVDVWVGDLFERILETVSLFNVDLYRNERAAILTGKKLRPRPIAGDNVSPATSAYGSRDALRNKDLPVGAPDKDVPLPITEQALTRHRQLSDLQQLVALVRERPGRLRELIREPFRMGPNENDSATTMRMPPFMRHSNAFPLTLTNWQYELLMDWVTAVVRSTKGAAVEAAARKKKTGERSEASMRRREQVQQRLRAARGES